MDILNEIKRFNPETVVNDAYTPPGTWYTDQDFYQHELDSVFKENWAFVGFTKDIEKSGDFFTGQFENIPYIVCKNEKGEITAFYNVCSHHGTCVARGKGNQERFVCPYHGWNFDFEGKLRKVPKAGKILDLKGKELNLKEIPLKIIGTFIFLFFGKDSQKNLEFPEALKRLKKMKLNDLKFVKQVRYTLNCNWKVYVDNYLDGGYHVPHMHPGLNNQIDFETYGNEIFDTYSIQSCKTSKEENTDKEKDFKERVGKEALYVWIYPNFMINRYGKWMDTNWAIPLGPDKCEIVFDYFYDGEIEGELLEQSMKASHQVQLEDMDICHMVQTGLNSGVYERGVYAPQFEAPMFEFHKLLYQDLVKTLSK